MLRVGDLQKSIDYYQNVLGMKLLRTRYGGEGVSSTATAIAATATAAAAAVTATVAGCCQLPE
jgi:catechol 2,3-dioxygenase-like lactoylglutathione lyase family enzyme